MGNQVNRVELKNIIPPAAIQDAMEKQMKAERERREAILRAEGEKKSTVLVAEGEKESVILKAEAENRQRSSRQKQKKKRGSKRLKVKRKPFLKYSRQMQTVSVSSVKRVQTRQCLRSRVWRHLKRLQTARQRKSSFRQNCSHLRGL